MVMVLNKYIKDGHIIEANPKAYEVCYKEEGYIPYVEGNPPISMPKRRSNKKKVEE